jgi:hypothetical protein
MLTNLGWMLLAGLPFSSPPAVDVVPDSPARWLAEAPGRVAVWADRREPYHRGDAARVYLSAEHPTHVAVLRVDTDGRIEVLFPSEPWGETYVREARQFEVTGGRTRRSFIVDDDPGIGYLFAVASAHPFDFEDIALGDRWDFRAIEGGRIRGDPYVALAGLAARLAPGDDYDYDVNTYHVERRYEYPRFVCYDCHAHAAYDEWDPYRSACSRFRVVIYDDPRYYPYRTLRGRNVVMQRPARPGPRYVFRDADPDQEYVTRVQGRRTAEYRRREETGRTSRDVGGRGAVPAPGLVADRASPRMAPSAQAVPARPPAGELRPGGRRRVELDTPVTAPKDQREQPAERQREADRERPERERRPAASAKPRETPSAKPRKEPRSTGEPELRRRKP